MARKITSLVRTLAYYAAFYSGSAIYGVILLVIVHLRPDATPALVRGWSVFHRACVTGLLGIKVIVRGTLPPGRTLVAVKHESLFEAIDMPCLLTHPAVFAKTELQRVPLWGPIGELHGLIWVARDEGAKALRTMITAAKDRLAQGRNLAIFPEGTRARHGTRPPLQSGFAGLYKMLDVPVVPIAVDSGPLFHRRWKRSGTITYLVGETIPPGLSRAEIEARVHTAINALNSGSVA